MGNRRCAKKQKKIERRTQPAGLCESNFPFCRGLGLSTNSVTVHGLGRYSCSGRRGPLHGRLLAHHLPRRGVLAAQPPIQGPLHLGAQGQFAQVLALLGARHESLLLEALALETVETHLPLLDLGHAWIAVGERGVGVDGAVGDGERWSAAIGREAV